MSGIAIERVHCVFSLCQRALQDLQRGDELRLDMRLRLKTRSGPSKLATGAVFGILQGLQRGFDSFSQGLRIGQAAVLGVEFFPFILAGPQLVDFADLPGQAFLFALQTVLGAAGLVQCFLRCAPSLPAQAQRAK